MIDEMAPYWQSKGWNLDTLRSKSDYQIKGIYHDFIKRCIKVQNNGFNESSNSLTKVNKISELNKIKNKETQLNLF